MLHSMTGFAVLARNIDELDFRWEMRSVNHRYLDITAKLPEDFRFLEPMIRAVISERLSRGKIECRLTVKRNGGNPEERRIDFRAVDALLTLNDQILARNSRILPLSVKDILGDPSVAQKPELDEAALNLALRPSLDELLDMFVADRRREGEALCRHLVTRLDAMENLLAKLSEIFPRLLQDHNDKINRRLRDAVDNPDNDRLQQEFALFVQKADIDEEFSRLRTHIAEVRRVALCRQKQQSAGKRLDFLMQELNREANTLGSKSIAAECTQTSVELKVLIEQMREQIQNIE